MVRISAAIAIAIFFFGAGTAGAEILAADLRVNGMTCPFCAYGIEKKLRNIDGVQEVEVLFDEGILRLTLAPDNKATTRDLDSAVKKSGFKLSGLTIKVRGKLTRDKEGPVLDVGAGLRFHLLEEGAGQVQPLSKETREKMRVVAAEGSLVVQGAVLNHAGDLEGILIEHFE